MAYTLYTKSFGSGYANGLVRITDSETDVPATILASATGGLVSENGEVRLNSSGNLSIYIDTSRTYNVKTFDGDILNEIQPSIIAINASRSFTTDDDGKTFQVNGEYTLTLPSGLSWKRGVYIQCPAGSAVSIAVSGGATINGASTTLTRTRANNQAGFSVVPTGALNVYGVSGDGVTGGWVYGKQPELLSSKITTKDGRLLMGGKNYRGVFINAVDLFFDFLPTTAVTSITQASPGLIGFGLAHGLSVNEPVYLSNIGGMTQLNGYYLVNTVPSGTSITVKTLAGVPVNTSGFGAYTSGGTVQRAWFITDLPILAGYGIKLIRVSMGHVNNASIWTSTIGTSGTTPNANLLTSFRIFLDQCWLNKIGVELSLFWNYTTIPAALSGTVTQYQTPGSPTRTYMTDLSSFMARNFYKHPALAAYNIGNEWFDIASLARFATVATDTGVDHLKFLADTCTEIVTAIRRWDSDRSIISPHGTGGRFTSGQLQEFIHKWLYSAGTCDVVALHLYPDTDRNDFSHCFVGAAPDIGGSDIFLSALRSACFQAGKVMIVDECAADDDATMFSGLPVGNFSKVCWDKCFAAGVELVADWSWYVSAAIGGGGASDLKTARLAVMPLIAPYNASLVPGFIAPTNPLPEPGAFLIPSTWARCTGAVGSHISIANNNDFSPSPEAGAKICKMFWIKRTAAFDTNPRIMSCDNGTNGYILTLGNNEGLQWQMSLGSAYNFNTVLVSFTYPLNNEIDPSKTFVGDVHHVAWYWDGTLNTGLNADNSQHFTLWIDGVIIGRIATTGKQAAGYTDRAFYIGSNSDGSGANSSIDIGDFMFGKNFTLTSQMVSDYLRFGIVPTGMQHRYKLDGNTLDSIGSLNATAGPGLQYIDNGIGCLY